MRSPADLARELTKVADAIDAADRHFRAQGEADAALHMSSVVRYNPLLAAVAVARDDIHRIIEELGEESPGQAHAALVASAVIGGADPRSVVTDDPTGDKAAALR